MHYLNDVCYAEHFKSVTYASISVRMLVSSYIGSEALGYGFSVKNQIKNGKERPVLCKTISIFLAQVSRKSEVFPCSAEKKRFNLRSKVTATVDKHYHTHLAENCMFQF